MQSKKIIDSKLIILPGEPLIEEAIEEDQEENFDYVLSDLICNFASIPESKHILYLIVNQHIKTKFKVGSTGSINFNERKIRIFFDFGMYYHTEDKKVYVVNKEKLLGNGNSGKAYKISYILSLDKERKSVDVAEITVVLKSQPLPSEAAIEGFKRDASITRLAEGEDISTAFFRDMKSEKRKGYFVMNYPFRYDYFPYFGFN